VTTPNAVEYRLPYNNEFSAVVVWRGCVQEGADSAELGAPRPMKMGTYCFAVAL
jgi:hypothetical protein